MRTIRYKEIANDLREKILEGSPKPGELLSSEASLSERYSASRVTIRKALEELRSAGLLESRQGYGWIVSSARPVTQNLDQLETIEAQLIAEGKSSRREILSFGFVKAPVDVAQQLDEDRVLEVKRLSFADDVPFVMVTVWCPQSLGSELSLKDVERSSFLEQLGVDVGGAIQTIGADLADAATADLLGVAVGSALLVTKRLTYSKKSDPLLLSRHQFPANLTEFAVELPMSEKGLNPAGLRLLG